MDVNLIKTDKKRFLDLLLLADEQESMIDRYLERGEMFALYDEGELKDLWLSLGRLYRQGQNTLAVMRGDSRLSASYGRI
jgi:hypothetical protein